MYIYINLYNNIKHYFPINNNKHTTTHLKETFQFSLAFWDKTKNVIVIQLALSVAKIKITYIRYLYKDNILTTIYL